jgi:hypothetical protein
LSTAEAKLALFSSVLLMEIQTKCIQIRFKFLVEDTFQSFVYLKAKCDAVSSKTNLPYFLFMDARSDDSYIFRLLMPQGLSMFDFF